VRHLLLTLATMTALTFAGGCATRPTPEPVATAAPTTRPPPVAAAALAFTPRVALDGPVVDLSREGRGETAFLGYDAGSVSYLYVRQDDRLRGGTGGFGYGYGGPPSRFERRAITETFATRVR